jgi:5-(carboxyamino)imidazole ribonucleotide synthase
VKLKPGDTIGILGGGQLGRMLAMAAARLGLRCQVFSPDPDSPAFDVVLNATCAEYADVEALELFANDVDVITYEFENVPAATAMILAARRPVLPDRKILETTQDRLAEKDFVKRLGIGTADYADVSSVEAALRAAIARIGLPAVIKTRRFGYDGKGQAIIRDGSIWQIWEDLGTKSAILEAFVPVRARDLGDRRAQRRRPCRMLRRHRKRAPRPHPEISRAPAAISERWRRRRAASPRRSPTRSTMSACSRSRCSWWPGRRADAVLVNEIAPRVHNSGHWTLDGASISQFEQHIRAIAGWPLGKPVRHGPVDHDQPDRGRYQRATSNG